MKNLRDMNIPVSASLSIARFAGGNDAHRLKNPAKTALNLAEYCAEKNIGGLLYAYRK